MAVIIVCSSDGGCSSRVFYRGLHNGFCCWTTPKNAWRCCKIDKFSHQFHQKWGWKRQFYGWHGVLGHVRFWVFIRKKKLGYSNVRDTLYMHVDKEDKGVANCDSLGGRQKTTIINDSGLYSLFLSSKLTSVAWVQAFIWTLYSSGGLRPPQHQVEYKSSLIVCIIDCCGGRRPPLLIGSWRR